MQKLQGLYGFSHIVLSSDAKMVCTNMYLFKRNALSAARKLASKVYTNPHLMFSTGCINFFRLSNSVQRGKRRTHN